MIFVRNVKRIRLLDKVQMKFIQISKLLNVEKFTIFIRQSYKISLTFRRKF